MQITSAANWWICQRIWEWLGSTVSACLFSEGRYFNPSTGCCQQWLEASESWSRRPTVIKCDTTVQRLSLTFSHKLCLIKEKDVSGFLVFTGYAWIIQNAWGSLLSFRSSLATHGRSSGEYTGACFTEQVGLATQGSIVHSILLAADTKV